MIKFECVNSEKLDKEILKKLKDFNRNHNEWFNSRKSKIKNKSFFAFEGNKLIGGAVGYVEYNWYYLYILFVEEKYRKQGVGSQILRLIED